MAETQGRERGAVRRPIFRDEAQQQGFDRDGYVVLPLLDPAAVAELRQVFVSTHADLPLHLLCNRSSFFSTIYVTDRAFKARVRDLVLAVVRDRLARCLGGHRLLGASFTVKPPGPSSALGLHQDPTLVDEDRYVSLNVWIPLVDCTQRNGALRVLRGSHRYVPGLRAPSLRRALEGLEDVVLPQLTTLDMRAGDAVLFPHALVHCSGANDSTSARVAVTVGAASLEAPLQFHYQDPARPGRVERWEQPDDFQHQALRFHDEWYARPTMGRLVAEFPYEPPRLPRDQLLESIRQAHGGRLPRESAERC